jgi:hypothetical protein
MVAMVVVVIEHMLKINFEEPFNMRKAVLFESLTIFVLKKLAPKAYSKITVNFELIRNLERDELVQADMSPEIGKDEYAISIDAGLNMRTALIAAAHELVHVKQFVLGENRIAKKKRDYFDDSLEIEAYGREFGLFVRWREECGSSKMYRWLK